MRYSLAILLALMGTAGCAASKVDAPPIIASPPPLAPVERTADGQPITPVDGSTCVTWGDGAVCARWVRDGQGNMSLQFQKIKR